MGILLQSSRNDLRVAVAGLGAIGTRVVEALDRGIDGLVLAAVSAQHPEKHKIRLAKLKNLLHCWQLRGLPKSPIS
jgi:aspartate dehydrogenase